MAKKGEEKYEGIDIGKVSSLRKAGWNDEEIAEEVGIEAGKVDEIVRYHEEREADKKNSDTPEPKQPRLVVLTDEELQGIYERAAAIGAQEGLKRFEQERKREFGQRADRRLRNTKLLLRNYRMLKEHAQNSVFSRAQMNENAFDILELMMSSYDNDYVIDSIKESAARTAIMVSHVETMIGLYAAFCDKSPNQEIERRRYDVVWDMYMAEETLSAKEIAEKQNMSKENVYADLRVAVERLTALIFGVDGLKVQ